MKWKVKEPAKKELGAQDDFVVYCFPQQIH